MKFRTGFVSNSSSSSFCILDVDDLQDECDNRYFEYLDNLFGKKENKNCNLEADRGDDYVIGTPAKSLKENLTILESKKDISFLTDGGRDG